MLHSRLGDALETDSRLERTASPIGPASGESLHKADDRA